MEVVIEKLIPGGSGLGRVDGKAVFVPGVLPGERVSGNVETETKSWSRLGGVEILEASAERCEPFCPLFGTCGGCMWQFMPYDMQVQTKEDFCKEALLRQGRLEACALPAFTIFKSRPTGYRSRIRPVIQDDGTPAFRGAGSHSAVPLNHCPIAVRGINQFLAHPPELKPGGEPIVFGDEEHFWVQSVDDLAVIELAGKKFEFPPGAFFQSNLGILPDVLNHVMKDLEGDFALDLYGGVGLFGAFLADRFRRVVGVERDSRAKEAWMRNVGSSGEFFAMSLEKWLKRNGKIRPDCVVVDPPRTGLGPSVRRFLCTLRAPKLVYVSCDPVTQARDLNELLGAGYNLSSYALADFYPQTPHVETIAILERNGK